MTTVVSAVFLTIMITVVGIWFWCWFCGIREMRKERSKP